MYTLPYKTKQIFFVLIKLGLVFAAFYFIYRKLSNDGKLDFYNFVAIADKNLVFSFKTTVFLITLSTFNWLFEIVKWQTLVSPIKNLHFKNALMQSLGALTVSIFTPNRIGEYGAKALFFNRSYRKQIVAINFIGNMLQLSASLIFGIIGLLIFASTNKIHINYSKPVQIALTLIFFMGLGYFFIIKTNFRAKYFSFIKLNAFIKEYPKTPIALGLCFSIIRYIIFSFQFYYLLRVFNIDISYLSALAPIASMYLLASVMPSFALFDFMAKGSIAVFIFDFLQVGAITIICITTLMWFLNFALPSLIGSYFVLRFKFPKNTIPL